MNIVVFNGHLTRDPELKNAKKVSVCNFGVAINERWTDSEGEKKESVSFIDVTAFGKTAETVDEYFRKGDPILIHGRLKQDTWEDKKSGENRSKVGVILERFEFISGKKDKDKDKDDNDDDRRDRKSKSKIDDDDIPDRKSRERSRDDDRRRKVAEPDDNDVDVPFETILDAAKAFIGRFAGTLTRPFTA